MLIDVSISRPSWRRTRDRTRAINNQKALYVEEKVITWMDIIPCLRKRDIFFIFTCLRNEYLIINYAVIFKEYFRANTLKREVESQQKYATLLLLHYMGYRHSSSLSQRPISHTYQGWCLDSDNCGMTTLKALCLDIRCLRNYASQNFWMMFQRSGLSTFWSSVILRLYTFNLKCYPKPDFQIKSR